MIWADSYDGKYTDEIFKFQSDIAIKIASTLNTIITPEEKQKLTTPPDIDITAYDYRLRVRDEKWKYWLYGDSVALNNAERFAEKALKLDPDNVRIWLSKVAFYWDRYFGSEEYYEENYMDSVLWYCEKASQIDPESGFLMKGSVYHQRGYIKSAIHAYRGDQEKALQYLRDYEKKVFVPPDPSVIPIYFTQYDILFKPLWNNPEFKALLKKEQEKKEAG